jgi:hypothetical protein
MQIQQQSSPGSVELDRQSLWHFRVLPAEAQRCTVRRLTLCGFSDEEIAARTGWPLDRVRQVRREQAPLPTLQPRSGSERHRYSA